MKIKLYMIALSLLTINMLNAQFSYKRELEKPHELWHRIEVLPEVLEENNDRTADFRILSIRDEDTISAPYVLQTIKPQIEETDVALDVLNHSVNRSNGYSYVTFRLKEERDYNYMNFDVSGNNFNIYLTLEGSHDGKEWFEFANRRRIVAHDDEYATYRYTQISFPTVNYPYVRVKYLTKHPRWYLYLFDKIYKIKGASMKKRLVKSGEIDSLDCQWSQSENKKDKSTKLTVKLSQKRRVSSLSIVVKDTLDFYRTIKIEAITDSVKDATGNYRYLTKSVYHGVITSYEKPVYQFPEVFTNQLRVTINNQDNMHLHIGEVKSTSYKLFLAARFADQGDYALYYGDTKLRAPSYDIVRFNEQLKQEMPSLKLGKATQLTQETVEKVHDPKKFYMWGAILAVLALMTFFTVKMIKNEKGNEA